MKKLKIKVFMTIFIGLSIFILGVLILNNYRNYNSKKKHVEDTLFRHEMMFPMNDDRREIFLDSTVYTALLDDNNNYKGIINHTSDAVDESEIKEVVDKIVHENKTRHVGNLYFNSYAYKVNSNNTIMIVDLKNIRSELLKDLITSLVIFVIMEIISYLIARYLTRWIIEPVNESFERQKKFVADASHELKTPLAVIMASVDSYTNDNNIKWVNNIKSESDRMNKLITNLLDLAETESGKENLMKIENLSDIISSVVLTFESLFYEKNIKLESSIKDDIKLKCNKDDIKELMSILIDNAIKYSDKLGKVDINLYTSNKNIILEVKNRGIEIKKEDEEKIFERFYKVDLSRNRDNNNYGLGLSIAKNIVLNHNGKISASSNDGITTFKVVWSQK